MHSFSIEDISGASRTGRRRASNEDRFGWFAGARVVALADGLAGRPHGALASRLAVDAVARMIEGSGLTPTQVEALDEQAAVMLVSSWFQGADKAVRLHAHRGAMFSTLLVAVLTAERLVIGNAGHSRGYRYSDGVLTQLTRDHRREPPGLDDLDDDDRRELLSLVCVPSRGIGHPRGVEPEFVVSGVAADDVFLLGSNGLFEAVDSPAVAANLREWAGAGVHAERLIAAADAARAEDDATAVVLRVAPKARRRGIRSRDLHAAR